MTQPAKFEYVDGQPVTEQVEEWAEQFFDNLLNVISGFYSKMDIKDAAASIKSIDFAKLASEQLEEESPEAISIAKARINELAEMEVNRWEAYAK